MSDDVRSAAPIPTNKKKWKERNAVERIQLICFAIAVAVLLYGVIRYPDSPIALREDGHYRDKARRVYTEPQFRSFKMWQYAYFGSFAVVLALTAVVEVMNRRRRT
jgi:hypothetical protein